MVTSQSPAAKIRLFIAEPPQPRRISFSLEDNALHHDHGRASRSGVVQVLDGLCAVLALGED